MCTRKPKSVPLPEQHTLCSTPNSGCRYVEVKTGKNRWEKRTAVLVRPDGDSDQMIYIYTRPLIGQSFPLKDLKTCEAKREKNGTIVLKLATDKQKIAFKISGSDAGLWVAAVMSCAQATLTHETHGPTDGTGSNVFPNIKDEPDNANYTGSREGYVMPVQEGSLSDEKKKKKEEEKNQNDPSKDPAQKSDEKKPESAKKVASKTKTKDSTTTESGRKKKKKEGTLAATQTLDGPAAKADDPVIPVQKTDSEPDNNCDPQLKKTQTETQETSGKGNGETPNKLVTPISATPAGVASLTPTPGLNGDAKDDQKVKTLTNSDENEVPEKKK